MASTKGDREERGERADAVLAEVLRLSEAGQPVTLDELCRRHPDLEPELRERYAGWMEFGRRLHGEVDDSGVVELGLGGFEPREPAPRMVPLAGSSPWVGFAKSSVVVFLLLVAAAYVLRRLDPPAEAFQLAASYGGDQIEADPLFVGPERRSVTLTFTGSAGDDPTGGRLAVLDDETGKALPGFEALWVGRNEIRFDALDLEGYARRRVRLEPVGRRAEFRPFTVVTLGDEAWRIAAAGIEDSRAPEPAGAPIEVDPAGLEVSLWIEGEAREDLERIDVRASYGRERRMLVRERGERATRYGLSLAALELRPGPTEVLFEAKDAAGLRRSHRLAIEVVTEPVLVDVAGVFFAEAEGEWRPVPRTTDGLVLAPGESPVLRVETRRASDLEWRLFVDGDDAPVAEGRSTSQRVHEVPLAQPFSELGADATRGRIEYVATEERFVEREPGSPRGRRTGELAFLRSAGRARFTARLVDRERQQPLVPGTVAFTTGADLSLRLEGGQPVPARFFVRVEGPEGELDPLEPRTVDVGEAVELPLELLVPGEYRLVVQSFQLDPESSASVDRPDEVQTLRVVVDARAPSLALTSDESTWTGPPPEGGVEFLARVDRAGPADAPLTALRCRLLGGDDGDRELRSWTVQGQSPFRIGLEGLEADGAYALEVSGTDLAGNAVEPVVARFDLARRGPLIELLDTAAWREAGTGEVGAWNPDASGLWSFRVRVEDPNGVALVDGLLRSAEDELGVALAPVDGVLEGRVELNPSWSEAEVDLVISALDRFANETVLELESLKLPAIRAPRVPRVEVTVGDVPVSAMRLVAGNADGPWVFGGRGDELENELLRSAGAPPLSTWGARGPRVSRGEVLAPGELEDFYLDEREVTVAEFLAFVLSPTGYTERAHWPDGAAAPSTARSAELLVRLRAADGALPVRDVTWEEAAAFAAWSGKRLPTLREWEYAVRGGERYRPFAAWRGTTDVARPGARTEPIASDASLDVTGDTGLRDLCTNVAEWTRSECPESAGSYWVAGGSYATPTHDFAVVDDRPRGWSGPSVGFRCAQSARVVQTRLAEPPGFGSRVWRASNDADQEVPE